MLEAFSRIPASFADMLATTFSAGSVSVKTYDAILIVSGRIFILLHAIGIIAIFSHIAYRELGARHVWPILMSSILFLTFFTAVRPHIPVTFWTMLACSLSFRLRRECSIRNALFAYGASIIAFCSLQSGILAFVFPLWGSIRGARTWKNAICLVCLGCSLMILVPIFGYPFLLNPIFGNSIQVGIDLGHNYGFKWNGYGFMVLLRTLIGSEIFLLFFALLSAIRLFRGKDVLSKSLVPIIIFISVFVLVFGMYGGSSPRFFIVLLPFIALLGVRSFVLMKPLLKLIFLFIVFLIHLKLAYLLVLPNTYAEVSTYITTNDLRRSVTTAIPKAHFPMSSENFLHGVGIGAYHVALDEQHPPDGWKVCKQFIASHFGGGYFYGALWNDIPWAFYQLILARRIGPNLVLWCSDEKDQLLVVWGNR